LPQRDTKEDNVRELTEAAKAAIARGAANGKISQPEVASDETYDLLVENRRLREAIVTLAMLLGKER
jgi:hypothetical protein